MLGHLTLLRVEDPSFISAVDEGDPNHDAGQL